MEPAVTLKIAPCAALHSGIGRRSLRRLLRRRTGPRASPPLAGVRVLRMCRARTCAPRASRPVIRSEDLSVVGIVEVLGHLPRIWRRFRELIARAAPAKAGPRHPHRLPGFPLPGRPETEAARDPGGLPRRPAGLGVAQRPRENHAPGHRPVALYFSVRRGVFPRNTRVPVTLYRPPAGNACPADAVARGVFPETQPACRSSTDSSAPRQPSQRSSPPPAGTGARGRNSRPKTGP